MATRPDRCCETKQQLLEEDVKTLEQTVAQVRDEWARRSLDQQALEEANNRAVAELYDLADEVPSEVPLERVSLKRNSAFTYPTKTPAERDALFARDQITELISYAVGCMMGRYSLDAPGLILASQGETLGDYAKRLAEAGWSGEPTFAPDADGVIPVTDEERFTDDVVTRFREFLRVAFGEQHFETNLRYIEQTLGTATKAKSLRTYFRNDFYPDHVKRYKNRPIYWLFSSRRDGKGAYSALVYLHRYTPAMIQAVLGQLRELNEKLRAEEGLLRKRGDAADIKRADMLREQISECEDHESEVLFPLATDPFRLRLDLDDGVLVNYLRFGLAVAKIDAIEKKRKDVQGWTWPVNPLRPQDAR